MTERNPGYGTKQGGVEKAPEKTHSCQFLILEVC